MAAATPRAGARPLEVPRALQEGDKFVRWDEVGTHFFLCSLGPNLPYVLHLQDSGVGCPVTLKVDQNGFYLYWTDQNNVGTFLCTPLPLLISFVQEVDMIDLVTVRDTRNGKNAKIPKVCLKIFHLIACENQNFLNNLLSYSQDPKLRQIVSMGAQEPLEDKTLTVCYGSDFVNPNFVNFCCSNKETAEVGGLLHGATCGCAAYMYITLCAYIHVLFFL